MAEESEAEQHFARAAACADASAAFDKIARAEPADRIALLTGDVNRIAIASMFREMAASEALRYATEAIYETAAGITALAEMR